MAKAESKNTMRRNPHDTSPISGPDLAEWSERAAEILECEDNADALADAILRALEAIGPTHLSFISIYTSQAQLQPALFWHHPVDLEVPATFYSPHLMRLDPFGTAIRAGQSGALRLWELAPPGFSESEIYRLHFVDFGVTDEVDHVKTHGRDFVLTAGACAVERLAEEVLSRHNAAHPLIAAGLTRLAKLIELDLANRNRVHPGEIDSALDQFGQDVLTKREMDVVHLILRGHNSESVAHQLGITWHTTRRHRSKAYSKLGVSSQGELFYEFLRAMGLDTRGV